MVATLLIAAALGCGTVAAPPELTGTYSVRGSNPGGKGAGYSGTAEIKRSGDAWRVTWAVGKKRYQGTGIITDGVLSVAYTEGAGKWFGVVAYKIKDGGKRLVGRWTGHGGKALGLDVLTRQPATGI